MSDLLFKRKIQITFGKPGPGETQTRVSQLLIQIDMEKNSQAEPNKGTVAIHNLNQNSRALLQQSGVSALVEAGYGDSLDKLFVGQVRAAPTVRQGRETVTTIEFQDGIEQYQKSRINKAFAPGVTNKQVLQALADSLKVGIGAIKGLVEGQFQQGLSLSSDVKSALDDITGKMGLEWSIQDNNLQILPPKTPSEFLGLVLAPDTGLIGSPTEREDSKNGGKFLEFRALLRPQIRPGVAVQIQSRDVNGYFKVRKAHYTGDNRKGPFEVQCEATEVASGVVTTSDVLNVDGANVIQSIA